LTPVLAERLSGLLPVGTDLYEAANGFSNFGLFVAAVNVSHNHEIPFTDMKMMMVDEGMSLGHALQALKPDDVDPDMLPEIEQEPGDDVAGEPPLENAAPPEN
jgi:hypothetical protein